MMRVHHIIAQPGAPGSARLDFSDFWLREAVGWLGLD